MIGTYAVICGFFLRLNILKDKILFMVILELMDAVFFPFFPLWYVRPTHWLLTQVWLFLLLSQNNGLVFSATAVCWTHTAYQR